MRTDRLFRHLAALACLLVLSPVAALAGGPGIGRIDWAGLRAVGYANPDATPRQAVLSARKNLLATLRRVQLTADLTVEQRLRRDPRAAERLRVLALASTARIGPAGEGAAAGEAGTDTLQAVLPLAGEVLELLLPPAAQFNTGLAPRLTPKAEPPAAETPAQSLRQVEQGLLELRAKSPLGAHPLESFRQPAAAQLPVLELADTEHSGLVVDARGAGVTPAVLPVLYDEAGVGLYGVFLVPRNSVVRQGLVVYARSLDDAALRARGGAAPLVATAAGPARGPDTGPGPGTASGTGPDLRLAAHEAQAVRALLRAKSVPGRCAVAILLD